ncbi:hypothetical protein A2115_01315 [Candidatus Woesebacteria bacterium GWA1_41_8]|jgi:Zn-dependent protease|uniref:Peptidase M50 domain-containing protein n=1 Tax=Candidatus Woesebacteria bacterium GWA1_41_8 TaxID=1802471 RepID=A0A1F7WHF2_9BACT|nr:MAG: hypothetical protein A2115_01315 [Candidatus Woesebacteria bacterium GWA1_41_8]
MSGLSSILLQVIAFFAAITVHEAAHAWMAYRLGDPTAKVAGRLSLNPIAHIDLYGTILIPFFLILIGSPFVFGWAKPVVFDPYNLKNPRRDSALISLAGPASNVLFAIILSIILRLIYPSVFLGPFLIGLLYSTVALNVLLALFNLIPIHPLDGGKIFIGLLPEKEAIEADQFLNRYGVIILIFLIFPFAGRSPVFAILTPIFNFILNILLPGSSVI